LPGVYQNVLICGISTQLCDLQADWDDEIRPGDADFARSGLHRASAIRPSYAYAADVREIAGVIGRVDAVRLDRVRQRLARLLS
jgi:mRNA interferase MazF